MKALLASSRSWLEENYIALIFALLVGLISVAPHLLAWHALGASYQGIPFFYSDNEDYYLSRIHEIADGYYLVGSPYFFEYKNILPTALPVGEYFYILLSVLFHLTLPNTLILAKFIFPAILFLLAYHLIRIVSESEEGQEKNIWGAIAGGLLITLGNGIVDYATLLTHLTHQMSWPVLSMWVRPVNPITGAILLFLFLIFLWRSTEKKSLCYPFFAAIILALSIGYIFTTVIAFAVAGIWILIQIWGKDLAAAKRLGLILLIAVAIDSIYFIQLLPNLSHAGSNLAGRNGLMLTHAPLLNKVLLLSFSLFFLLFAYVYRVRKINIFAQAKKFSSLSFSLTILVACMLALNQQVLTGKTIWPYHFSQYSNILAIVSLFIASFMLLRPYVPFLWKIIVTGSIVVSIALGTWNASSYVYAMNSFSKLQDYAPLFEWLNTNAKKDCVILISEDENAQLSGLIPAFTSCNVYFTANLSGSVPLERVEHNFFVELRLHGISSSTVDQYLTDNEFVIKKYFYKDWVELFDPNKNARIESMFPTIANKYRVFIKNDFKEELEKYHIDYLIVRGNLDPSAQSALPGLRKVYSTGSTTIFTLE